MTILIIGFQASEQQESASEAVISKTLEEQFKNRDEEIDSELIRVEPASVADMHQHQSQQLVQMIFQHRPDILLFVGQAAGRSGMMLERSGMNFFIDQRIVDEGPAAYWQTLPDLQKIVSEANADGTALGISNFAGTNMTNHLLYSALHLAGTEALPIKAGLLHLPLLDWQCEGELADQPHVTLDQASETLGWLCEHLLDL